MSTIFIWVCIAVVGVLLYIAPLFKYEGFVDMSTNMSPSKPGFIQPAIQSTKSAMTTIEDLLLSTPSFDDPEFGKPPASRPPPQPADSTKSSPSAPIESLPLPPLPSVTHQADSHDPAHMSEMKSTPDATLLTDTLGSALEQGSAFLGTNTFPPLPNEPIAATAATAAASAPVCPPCPQPICPELKCPPPPRCPPQKQCPDMKDYIRKDNIPCWGCQLD